jgi:hypothetical protein
MTAYLFPVTQAERLSAIGLYNALLYFIDDQFDRHDITKRELAEQQRTVFKEAVEIFLKGGSDNHSDPISRSAAALHRAFSHLAPSPDWLQRFLEDSFQHLQSSLQDIQEMEDCQSWYQAYLRLRLLDSGMTPTLDLIEFALGKTLDSSLYHKPDLELARHYVALYCALSNDLFSYEKEVLWYGSGFNALVMLERDGFSLEAAVAHLIHELNQILFAFHDLQASLAMDSSPEFQAYLDGLWQQLVAAYHWQFATQRYRSSQSPFIELRSQKS